jgi:hypothetical protein
MSSPAPDNNGKVNNDQWPKEWTVLLYMAGDNNLSEECVFALTEIKQGLTDNPRLSVLAQFDPAGPRAATRRFELHSTEKSLSDDVRWEARETDTGEPNNLLDFIRWGISTYPAEHYMVVLLGHGTGTDDDFLRDDNPSNSLSILEFQEVFANIRRDGHTIDILGMDTCLMSMAEVCYEMLRNNVTYMVGSEGFAPNTGWPYRAILGELSRNISPDGSGARVNPRDLAVQVVDHYQDFYEPYRKGGISVDQSVLEVAKIEGVQQSMFSLVRNLEHEFETGQLEYFSEKQNALILAHWEAQSYNGESFIDLYDFCERLRIRYPDDQVKEHCERVKDAIRAVVVKTNVCGAAFQFSFGLSIYFPWGRLSTNYGNLSFPKATNWIDFLQLYLNKTRRRRDEHAPAGDAQAIDAQAGAEAVVIPAGGFFDTAPVRSTVPNDKGRNGNVESMRNPPLEDVFETTMPLVEKPAQQPAGATNGNKPRPSPRIERTQWDPKKIVTKEEAAQAVEKLSWFFMP